MKMYLYEALKKQKTAYVTPNAFFPRYNNEIWVDLFSEAKDRPTEEFSCQVHYAEIPGVYAEIVSTTHVDVIRQGLGYDLVGYHLNFRPNSFLPVFMGCNET